MNQVNLFGSDRTLKLTKPIRLIELFAGIGAQAKALENLKVNFESYRVVEFDESAIKSYNAVHGTNFETLDITKISAEDLNIVDTDKYDYILTYSFPCQDISLAGLQRGYKRGAGTRSGLLWEVERLLKEISQSEKYSLPKVLLMENVPQVVSEKNYDTFSDWVAFLESLGYKNSYAILNSKDFGVPQNRERCFMVSWIDDSEYTFPTGGILTNRLKDVLEDEVDRKYFLSQDKIEYINNIDSDSTDSVENDEDWW